MGSPPRMRGKAMEKTQARSADGITPAYAGKRVRSSSTSDTLRDHPRVCGEKLLPGSAARPPQGSPPRMRGKAGGVVYLACKERITPAYAGKSKIVQALVHPVEDHPRVCGEKICEGLGRRGALGSPPRMRGKEYRALQRRRGSGITPAYAGKSPVRGAAFT